MTQFESLSKLLDGLVVAYGREEREGAALAVAALKDVKTKEYRRTTSTVDPEPVLLNACALPNALPICAEILGCNKLLDWTCWEGKGLSSSVSARLFSTELVGPDGHFPSPAVRVGLLVSEPLTDYPISSHSGEETYFVIAGEAKWAQGDACYRSHSPGEFVHHPAWMPHGRRTDVEPFLGAWRWSGDLDLATFSVD